MSRSGQPAAPLLAVVALLLGALVLLGPSPAAHAAGGADEDAIRARLVHKDDRDKAGDTTLMQVELTWTGRPERFLPRAPELDVPRGAVLRMGRSGSTFDGKRTRWWTDAVVSLPPSGSGWKIGPAEVEVASPDGSSKTLKAEAIRLGRRSKTQWLVSQGIGTGAVLLFVFGYLGWRWKALSAEESETGRGAAGGQESLVKARLEAAEAALEGPPVDFLQTLLALVEALDAALESGAPIEPSADDLRVALDAARFGGEEPTPVACRDMLRGPAKAARALLNSR